jgi:hypothetical protein
MGWMETEGGLQDITPKLCNNIQSLPSYSDCVDYNLLMLFKGRGGIGNYFGNLSQHISTEGWRKMQSLNVNSCGTIVTAGLQVVRYNSNFLPHLCILGVKLVMYKAVARTGYCSGCRFFL